MPLDPAALGKRLRQKRTAKHWPVQDLADTAGVSADSIYKLETGRKPDLETLVKLADALRVSIDWLIDGGKDRKR